ncbi:MAG TPA: hypothetical protein VE995_01100, partial [Gaiellaceae bacterium]|nr:hypothetical protein [Gaiellaceae bacterium]
HLASAPPIRRALRRSHCGLGTVARRYSRRRRGLVIAQQPRPGRHLHAWAAVRVTVSRGRRP